MQNSYNKEKINNELEKIKNSFSKEEALILGCSITSGFGIELGAQWTEDLLFDINHCNGQMILCNNSSGNTINSDETFNLITGCVRKLIELAKSATDVAVWLDDILIKKQKLDEKDLNNEMA